VNRFLHRIISWLRANTGRCPVAHQPEAHRRRSLADSWARPVHAADMAQARLFDHILHSEIAELEGRAESAESRWLPPA
jgi:hypothetical protein